MKRFFLFSLVLMCLGFCSTNHLMAQSTSSNGGQTTSEDPSLLEILLGTSVERPRNSVPTDQFTCALSATGTIIITAESAFENVILTLTDMSGACLFETSVSFTPGMEYRIPLNGLPIGKYTLNLRKPDEFSINYDFFL